MTKSAYVRACAAATPFPGNPEVFERMAHKNHSRKLCEMVRRSSGSRSHKIGYVAPPLPLFGGRALTEVAFSRSRGLSRQTSTLEPARSQDGAGSPRGGRSSHCKRERSRAGLEACTRRRRDRQARARARGAWPSRVDLRSARRFDCGADEARSESLPSLRVVARAAFGGALPSLQRSTGGAR